MVDINVGSGCDKLGQYMERLIYGKDAPNNIAAKALSGCTFDVGLSSDGRFGVPSHARDAIFVGDAAWIAGKEIDAATEAMFQAHPENVVVRPEWRDALQRWVMKFSTRLPGDALDPIAGQLFSPWNISYMAKLFKEPLAYSNVDKMVSYHSGDKPWAELFTLFLEQYAGWAIAGQTGDPQNVMISDVNVQTGMMSAPIINISGTYSLTLEEQMKGRDTSPFGESPMTRKTGYLKYVIDMMKAIIAYYGNEGTNTDGFMQVNPITTMPANQSIKYLASQTQPGYKIYMMLAQTINNMIVLSDGKFQSFKWAMCPEALAILKSTPYSEIYDPTSALKIFMKNYGATTKDGSVPDVEFVSEPLLKPNSMTNPSVADYSIITVPEVAGGPSEEMQPIAIFGAPLQKFVFPAIPGQYNTQYKTLSRLAGIIAPVPAGIRVFQGLGVQ